MGTVPVPYSPTAGDDATQARVLTWADAAAYLLGSATSGGSKRGLCVMRQTVAQSIPSATSTNLLFDTEDVDYDNGHSTVTSTTKYTAQTAGWYLVSGVYASATGAGERDLFLAKNGAAVPASRGAISGTTGNWACVVLPARLIQLNAADFIELVAVQTTAGALNTAVAADIACSMTVEWRSN